MSTLLAAIKPSALVGIDGLWILNHLVLGLYHAPVAKAQFRGQYLHMVRPHFLIYMSKMQALADQMFMNQMP
ncbi:hypothetical protein Ngar_c15480 [Candidatus Nitrososphaera gargensis Ga9.2]|uniref:Uncharacterized protein n=1 Tax=Nitrososphaera gargensis (strain Ga9.2) TaxID=1237085 RepID=K0IJM7_NITGG|nr:hypothetical protein Ngar_c15480 [Candidatus Nitrososphaera gargensis Ga9.2]